MTNANFVWKTDKRNNPGVPLDELIEFLTELRDDPSVPVDGDTPAVAADDRFVAEELALEGDRPLVGSYCMANFEEGTQLNVLMFIPAERLEDE